MDRLYARRLERDDNFRMKLEKLCKDYIKLGEDNLNFYAASFDAAHDAFQGYSRLSRKDLEALDHGHPRNFVLPILSTQITTMATSISSALFGDFQTHKTEGRSPEDEAPSDLMNQLLRWNDEQQPWFVLGFMWTINSLLYNRGIFHESYEPMWKTVFDRVEMEDPEDMQEVAVLDAQGQPVPDPTTGMPATQLKPAVFDRWVKRKVRIGGYNKVYVVSPYDFICDPVFPLYRLQEMRFCGHKKVVPWIELQARSLLPIDDAGYVDPTSVEKLKSKGMTGIGTSVITPTTTVAEQSRTAYERTKTTTAPLGVVADTHDGGIVEEYDLRIRLIPQEYDIEDPESDEVAQSPANMPTVYRFRMGNKERLLSFELDTYAHDEYPYAIGEPRPSPHYQYTPSWALQLLPMQQHIDYLKNRHQEAITNTIGNIFIAKTSKVDLKDFLDPEKEGKIISVLPQADNEDLDDIIKQVPIQDFTKGFAAEMEQFINFSTMTSGATDQLQGKPGEDVSATGEQSATAAARTRLGCIAKILSVQALTPQTRRFVSNFQQFQQEDMWMRIRGDVTSLPKQLRGLKGVKITRDTIQGDFDFIAHDGTLPDLDPRAVAAGIRLIESGATFPAIFGGLPGDLDLRKLVYTTAKKAGLKIENLIVPAGAPPPTVGGQPIQAGAAPDGGPPAPPPAQPGPGGENLPSQDVGGGLSMPQVGFPSAEPAQVRPQTG